MRIPRIGVGPLVAVAFLVTGAGFAATAYVAQIEPEPHVPTNLPLARI